MDGEASGGSSSSIGALPQQGAANSGLHPLVLLNRQEFGGAAEQHLVLMLKQLLAAEDVQQAEVGWTGLAGGAAAHSLQVDV